MRTRELNQLELKYDQRGLWVIADESHILDIALNFKPEVYLDLLNPEGEYLPTCCANISRVRDIIYETVRNDCLITPELLFEACDLLKTHDDGPQDSDAPLYELFNIKDKIDQEDCKPHKFIKTADVQNIEQALATIAISGSHLSFPFLNSDSFDKNANHMFHLLQMIPAITTLYKKLSELDFGKQEVYAICNEANQVVQSHGGCLFFRDEAKAKWYAKEGEQVMGTKYMVKKANISMEEGLVFEGENHGI